GELRKLFRTRLAVQLLPQDLRRLDDAREISRAVERNANGTPLARERGQDRLTNPPHGVRNELYALIRIELAGSGQQADVALADEIDERQAAVLIFLGDRNHETQVALHEFLQRVGIAGADLTSEIELFR